MNDNLKGACFMMGSMATFTCNDAVIKYVAQGMPTFQMVFLRGVGATLLLVVLARFTGVLRAPVPRDDWKWVIGRALAEVASFFPFILALTHMPLANVTAILQALPLAITAAGALFLGERVGWRRWTAITVGFVGVLMIVRPGGADFDRWSLVALAAVVMISLRELLTRRLSRDVPSLKVAIFTAVGVTILGLAITVPSGWAPVSAGQGGLIAAASVFILGGYLFSIMAMRVGEVAAVTPFRYTALIWGLLLGWAVFGDWPKPLTLIGAALVVSTGIYTLLREGRRAPVPRPNAPR
ncbi:S-adenosylmethionine uptake transporter [Jannaschia faecimaris]|uniref:S-adenosylmethionine uptake transporter n=1 Tax=Jannaschia faecimaris TaxID=1244108 RepID=A0A1H3UL96_9RHOB|nr:DMT family transporter [Jannaschia faecimaris]SDZ62615.1 S-adenosylmethionine uptake transporter [Jannaschia faecimaris]